MGTDNSTTGNIPEKILVNLRKSNKHKESVCLACGYSGLMGVKKESVPWYASWWFFAIAVALTLPFISSFAIGIGIAFAVIRFISLKYIVTCPNCETDLTIK